MIGLAGFDFVAIDIEHEPIGDAAIMSMIRAGDAHQLPVVVRSPMDHRLGTLLNFGAAGVQVPDVKGKEHLEEIVERATFPPHGRRPVTLLSRVAGYGNPLVARVTSDDDPVVIAMIEDVEVAAKVDTLLEVDGVDAFYVGPGDLRASMSDPSDAEVKQVISDVVSRCVAASRVLAVGVVCDGYAGGGGIVAGVADLPTRKTQGLRLFVVPVSMFLAQQLVNHRRELALALADSTH